MKILFVCTGNICRSPTAEGIMRAQLKALNLSQRHFIESAGTNSYHTGNPPHLMTQEVALKKGVDISDLRSRKITYYDFDEFDLILVMDQSNYDFLQHHGSVEQMQKVHKLLPYVNLDVEDVPDPYQDSVAGFEYVFDLLTTAIERLVIQLGFKEEVGDLSR